MKLLIAIGTASVAAGCDVLPAPSQANATVVAALVDPSGSTDSRSRCGEAIVPIRQAVEARHVRRVDVLVLATGNGASGEPSVLVPWTTYSPSSDLYATPASRAAHREEFLGELHRRCKTMLAPTDASPVYEGIARTLTSVSARCRELEDTKTPCDRRLLFVASDLRSTYGSFGRALRARPSKKNTKRVEVPPKLDASGIEILVCGVSNTAGGDGLQTDDVLARWREVLGDEAVFAPTCEVDRIALGDVP